MNLTVAPDSDAAPFDQVRLQVIDLITSGEWAAGTRLPTVRALAAEVGLATNTVARAYRELEAAGFIETRGRAGSFVKAATDSVDVAALAAARVYVDRVRALGVGDREALTYVSTQLGTAHPPRV